MLVRAPNGTYEFIDFRETAPAAAFKDMYNEDVDLSLYGGLASGVPGELRGLQRLHDSYGKLCWADVMAPAIRLARYGFNVTQDLVNYMNAATEGIEDFLVTDPAWAIDFAPNGTRVQMGNIMTRKRYADTLETVAQHGPDAFYTGAIANATITALRAANGTMTLADLKNYSVAIRDPAAINYKGHKVTSTTAPSGGIVALAILKIFGEFNENGDPAAINITTHRLDESMRWAYGERTELGDPSFESNVTAFEAKMISDETAEYIRSKISNTQTFNVSYYDPQGIEELPTPGTSHTVTADQSGMAVSLTTTVNLLFGSQLMVPETGVVMNDEMNDFSIPNSSNAFGYLPSPVNFVVPGKRPLSSISPTIVEFPNGTLYFVTGSAGGSRIITATVQSVWHVLDQNMTTAEALAQGRLHDQLEPNTVSFEWPGFGTPGYSNETTAFMARLGHNVTFIAPGQSSMNALRRLPNGTFEAAGEPRLHNSGGHVF